MAVNSNYSISGVGSEFLALRLRAQAGNLLRWRSRLVSGDVYLALVTARVGTCGLRRFAAL
jgi:hypothetical protein